MAHTRLQEALIDSYRSALTRVIQELDAERREVAFLHAELASVRRMIACDGTGWPPPLESAPPRVG